MEKKPAEIREEYDAIRKELNSTLGLSFCKLLEAHPLYDQRMDREGQDALLPVVLVGRGQPLELLRDKVLSNGQLLNTNLEVTVVTPEPEADMNKLMALAPELRRFIQIRQIDKKQHTVSARKPEWPLGTLTFEWSDLTDDDFSAILEKHQNCTYFLFDENSAKLADICAEDKNRIVTRIQKEAKATIDEKSRLKDQFSLYLYGAEAPDLSCRQGDSYLENIESIAYNLCYAYKKGNNPRATSKEIRDTFKNPYDYESNIECAVHIRSKLKCCGIDNLYTRPAARRFAELLEADTDGELVERLSCLEHRRWCISKLVQGFRLPPDLSKIYSEEGVGTHDVKERWHTCLVPYKRSRKLMESDWIAENPGKLKGLDPLDRQTLRIHRTCGQKLETANQKIEEHLLHIRSYDKLADAVPEYVPTEQELLLHKNIEELHTALTLLRKHDADAQFLYNRSTENLHDRAKAMDEAARKDLNTTLDKLAIHVGIWTEYVTRKDYKEQNRILIRQIPFALSKFQELTLVKLMSDKKEDCVSAAWQLEPARMVFVDLADSVPDLIRIWQMSKQINYFLEHSCNAIHAEYHIFICGDIQNMQTEYPEFFDKFTCTVHPIASADTNQIRPEFVELMRACGADYIDMTGGKPELVSIADGYARNSHVGAFIIRSEQLRSFYGADAIHGKLLNKGLSVRDVFAQSGAKEVKSDGEKLVGRIERDYETFWTVASGHAEYWHGFCMKFISKIREAAETEAKANNLPCDPLLLPDTHIQNQLEALRKAKPRSKVDHELPDKCAKILDDLFAVNLIEKHPEGYLVTSNELMSALVNSGKVLEYFIYFTAKNNCPFHDVVMSYQFKHSDDDKAVQNELDVICTKDARTLFISAKNVSAEKSESTTFLKHVCYEVEVLASRFGINPKQLLAAPNARQFENGKLSKAAKYCMERGVYLLGRECCQPKVLEKVLVKIMKDEQDWCEFLLDTVEAK